jgi:kynurenine formamidase
LWQAVNLFSAVVNYLERNGYIFDVSGLEEIRVNDIDTDRIKSDMFIGFHTGFIEEIGYGNARYFHEHPVLTRELIELLVARRVSIIGIDFAGVRRHEEHTPTDQYCADNGVFIVENLCNMKEVTGKELVVYTFPLNYGNSSGLPCRVVAKI